MNFSREGGLPEDFTDVGRQFRAWMVYINGNEPSDPEGFSRTSPDDWSIRYNHCARFFYRNADIAAVS